MNIGYLPVDVYSDQIPNHQPGIAPADDWVPGCSLATVRACYQNALANYYNQGVRGIRFIIGMAGAGHSTALAWNGSFWTTPANWYANLATFLADVKNANLSVTPAFQIEGQAGDVYTDRHNFLDPCTLTYKSLRFYPTAPFAFDLEKGGSPHGQGLNRAYDCSPAPPDIQAFAGWGAIQNVINYVIYECAILSLNISGLELQNEVGLSEFTVYARLFYDNKNGHNLLGTTRSAMSAWGFDPYRVTYSTGGYRTWRTIPNEDQPFSDVGPSHPARYFVNVMKQEGITLGCGGGSFCEGSYLSRAQMAAFIVRAVFLGNPAWQGNKPCYGPSPFQDVNPSNDLCEYIGKAKELGITRGCTETLFCPDRELTWTEMTIFTIRGLQVAQTGEADDLFTDYPTYPYYPDILQSHWAFKWIQKAYQLGVFRPWVAGKPGFEIPHPVDTATYCISMYPGRFCENDRITRASSSFLIVRGVRNKFDGDQFDCYSTYGDSARLLNQSELFSGMTGGLIGTPREIVRSDYQLICGGSPFGFDGDNMYVPVAVTTPQSLPGLVDMHLYSCKNASQFSGLCDVTNPKVATEAQQDFNAVKEFLAARQLTYFRAFSNGETHSGTSVEWGLAPGVGSHGEVQGFSASRLAGTFTIFRPWGELFSPHGRFPYVQQVNPPYYVQ